MPGGGRAEDRSVRRPVRVDEPEVLREPSAPVL
jgi:hypothetical protein